MKLLPVTAFLSLALFAAFPSFAKRRVPSDGELLQQVVGAYRANWRSVKTQTTESGLLLKAQFTSGSGNLVKCSADYGRILCCEIHENGEPFNYIMAE